MTAHEKTLDRKLARIRDGAYTPGDFIIADAKDGDMAFGVTAPGPAANEGGQLGTAGSVGHGGAAGSGGRGDPAGTGASNHWKPRAAHLDAIRQMTASRLIDVMLMSVSSAERLAADAVFAGSPVTPAVRLNDTTDIWNARESNYRASASRPFATADVPSASAFCGLGLYSMTFHNDVDVDLASLQAYREFRLTMRDQPMQHFLEIFNPAFDVGVPPERLGFYINDMIIKALAGVIGEDQPLFLKLQFNGAKAMRELAAYDPSHLIVGILGGGKGTTRDTFELISQAETAGARVALFGRKINLAEAPIELVRLMRATIERELTPLDAVHAYHDHLKTQGLAPERTLEADLEITELALKGQ